MLRGAVERDAMTAVCEICGRDQHPACRTYQCPSCHGLQDLRCWKAGYERVLRERAAAVERAELAEKMLETYSRRALVEKYGEPGEQLHETVARLHRERDEARAAHPLSPRSLTPGRQVEAIDPTRRALCKVRPVGAAVVVEVGPKKEWRVHGA